MQIDITVDFSSQFLLCNAVRENVFYFIGTLCDRFV